RTCPLRAVSGRARRAIGFSTQPLREATMLADPYPRDPQVRPPQSSSATPATPSHRRRRRKRRVGLSALQETRLRAQLRQTTPSEPWVEAQIRSADDLDRDGSPIVYRYHDPRVFPPGGPGTRMVRCSDCGVFTPPGAMEGGRCLECVNSAAHTAW